MMRRPLFSALLALSIVSLTAACDDNQIVERDSCTGASCSAQDTGTANDVPTDGDVGTDTSTGPVTPGTYAACSSDGECDTANGESCLSNVCIKPPTDPSHLAVELPDSRGGVIDFTDMIPEVECYVDGNGVDPNEGTTAPPDGQTVTVHGDIERFGDGPPTFDICVTFYDEERLLDYFDNSECNALDIGDERIACFRRDPCRCDDESDPAACHAEIGNCNFEGLSTAQKDACMAEFGGPVVYGYGKSECEDGTGTAVGCRDEGVKFIFRVPNIPVNTPLAVKSSGLEARWVDTFEYGAVMPWSKAKTDTPDPNTGQTDTLSYQANVIAIGAWDSIPTTAGLPFPIDKQTSGAVAGIIKDCGMAGRRTVNPNDANDDVPEIEDATPIVHGTVGFTQSPLALTYFNGNPDDSLPKPGRVDSNSLGVYAALGIPYGKNRVGVRVDLPSAPEGVSCGPCEGGVCPCSAGSRRVFVPPFSVVIATFEGTFNLN